MFDTMKLNHLKLIVLVWSFPIFMSGAGEEAKNLIRDFAERLEAAIAMKDIGAVKVLYHTNGVPAAVLAREEDRWRRVLTQDAERKMDFYGKELATLPSEQARVAWKKYAQQITDHHVTHIVSIQFDKSATFVLPLTSAEGKLWILPPEKKSLHIEPDGAANASQPIRTKPDSTSSPAGSHR